HGFAGACFYCLMAFPCPKPPPPEGVKSNPSKRHRDRLNEELNKLTGLLPFPEDVCTRFDKLSTLRLAVGYLKQLPKSPYEASPKCSPGSNSGLNLYFQALNGFVITVAEDGSIFYISPTVQNYLGFRQVGAILS
uniref:BHLH domain-containing protein n=1 Tax=Pavo cristatus TaxID=9049 RepID=A0A8C9EVM6_PAVCR